MRRTYRFTYKVNNHEHIKHFDADSQTAAVADFEVVTGLKVEKDKVLVQRLDGAGLVR